MRGENSAVPDLQDRWHAVLMAWVATPPPRANYVLELMMEASKDRVRREASRIFPSNKKMRL
jgi:hypothetical protein